MTVPNSIQPPASVPWVLMAHSAAGKVAAIEMNIRIDMPLPMPRSVMSSPSHMTTAVPAVMRDDHGDGHEDRLVRDDLVGDRAAAENSAPLRAVATRPVPCRMARATVR